MRTHRNANRIRAPFAKKVSESKERNDYKGLYESIMRNVSRVVRQALNEARPVDPRVWKNTKNVGIYGGGQVITDDYGSKAWTLFCQDIRKMEETAGLPHEREIELARRMHEAETELEYVAARNELANANMKLVMSFANIYGQLSGGRGVSKGDVLDNGFIGLLTAAEHYNPEHLPESEFRVITKDEVFKDKPQNRDVRFMTYAQWWLRKAMIAGNDEEGGMSRNQGELKRAVTKIRSRFFTRYEYEPDPAQIADIIIDALEGNEKLKNQYGIGNLAVNHDPVALAQDIAYVLGLSNFTSTETAVPGKDGKSGETIGDTIPGNPYTAPGDGLDDEVATDALETILDDVFGKYADLIKDHFGVCGHEKVYSTEDLAEKYGVSKVMVNTVIREMKSKLEKAHKLGKFYRLLQDIIAPRHRDN